MKSITQKEIRKQLIKIIDNDNIDEVMYEPRYIDGYKAEKMPIGSIITIRTSIFPYKNEK